MLHGNVLLSGWRLSDVSFYLTELPEYMLVAAARGLRPDVVQISAAITYALCVLGGALIGKDGATGREGVLRAALAAGIALVPLAGDQRTLVTNPDHTGTAVPILLLLLLLDRGSLLSRGAVPDQGTALGRGSVRDRGSQLSRASVPDQGVVLGRGSVRDWGSLRDRMPVIALVVLSAAVLSDQITLLIGVSPLVCVWLLRLRRPNGANATAGRHLERRLAVAACASALIGLATTQIIKAAGGWQTVAIPATFVGFGSLAKNFWEAIQGLLTLFNVSFTGPVGWHTVFAVCQLGGLLLVAAAVVVGIRSIRKGDDLVASILTMAIIIDFASFVIFIPSPQQNYREVDVIVPLGAALAGRILTGPLLRLHMREAIAVVLAGFAITFGWGLSRPTLPPANVGLGQWLVQHHLSSGICEYWAADSLIADTGGTVQMATVQLDGRRLTPNLWEADTGWYDSATRSANFMVLSAPSGSDPHPITEPEAVAALGPPWRVYTYRRDVIMVWHKNLLKLIQ